AWVKPDTLGSNSVLSRVNGLLNAVIIETDVGDYTVIGKGGGPLETAHSLLDDIISITGGLI
ncbi:MAG: homoserine dehydrogenase, partial [Acidilobaceae archaeon]